MLNFVRVQARNLWGAVGKGLSRKWFLGGCANRMQCDGRTRVHEEIVDRHLVGCGGDHDCKEHTHTVSMCTYKTYKMKKQSQPTDFLFGNFSESTPNNTHTVYWPLQVCAFYLCECESCGASGRIYIFALCWLWLKGEIAAIKWTCS